MSTEEIQICLLCKGQREENKMEPRALVALPLTTSKKQLPVLVCPFCDGDVLKLALGE